MYNLIDQFINFIKVEKGLVHNTVVSYSKDLNQFIKFLEENSIKSFVKIFKA